MVLNDVLKSLGVSALGFSFRIFRSSYNRQLIVDYSCNLSIKVCLYHLLLSVLGIHTLLQRVDFELEFDADRGVSYDLSGI